MGGSGSGRRRVVAGSVEELIKRFGRPLTTFEIHFLLDGVVGRRRVYREIGSKLKFGVFRDFVLDFRPFYSRRVRLVGLNVGSFEMKFEKTKKK